MGKLLQESRAVCSRELSIYIYMHMCPHALHVDSMTTRKLEATGPADLHIPDPAEASLPGHGRATARGIRGV